MRAAASLLKQSLPEYCELALPLFEQEIERLAGREQGAAEASAGVLPLFEQEIERLAAREQDAAEASAGVEGHEREGGAVHVDMAA